MQTVVGGWTDGWLVGWLVCVWVITALYEPATCKKKKKGKTFLPFQSRVCAPRRAEAAWHLGSCSFCAAPWKWPPPPVPSGPGQIFRSSSGKHFLGLEGVKWGGGGVQDLASEFFFPFVCLPLIDCGVLGLRPQRSGVKDVRCRANEATLIRFWPPSALTSSSRTPVPWRGDTFDLRLVLSASRCAFIILFFTSELDTSRDL